MIKQLLSTFNNGQNDKKIVELAIDELQLAISINNNFYAAHSNLGHAYRLILDSEKAILSYQESIKLNFK